MDAIQGLSNAQVIKVFRNLDSAFRKRIYITKVCREIIAVLKIIRYSYMHSVGKMQIVTVRGKCRYNCASKGYKLSFIDMRTSEILNSVFRL
jgi:hypothetical protein